MEKITPIAALASCFFYFSSNAQQLAELNIQQISPTGNYVATYSKKIQDALIIAYSSIPDIKFSSNMAAIDTQYYDNAQHRYILYISPITQKIKITPASDYIQNTITINASAKQTYYYKIEPKVNLSNGQFYLDSDPQGAKISIDGNPDFHHLTPYKFDGYAAQTYSIHLNLDGYYTKDTIMTINAKSKGSESLVRLKAIVGYLSVSSNIPGTKITISNVYSAMTPISNYLLRIGKYDIKAEKEGYGTQTSTITVTENANENVNFELLHNKNITILSTPDKADVYVDGIKQGDKTPANLDMTIGSHKIILQKDHYESLTTEVDVKEGNQPSSDFTFHLSNKTYKLTIKSNASNASTEGRSLNIGAPNQLAYGDYKITASRANYFSRSRSINLNSDQILKMNLVPISSMSFSLLYAYPHYYGGEFGGTVAGHLFLGIQLFGGNSNGIKAQEEITKKYGELKQTYSDIDANIASFGDEVVDKFEVPKDIAAFWGFKAGFVVNHPIQFCLTVGYDIGATENYIRVLKAGPNHYSGYDVNPGDYFYNASDSTLNINYGFSILSTGIEVHLLNSINIIYEYLTYLDKEGEPYGPKYTFGIGYNFSNFK